jgi:peptidoglycan/xylan/chitin deacetylase (PgdA/CDA1 family)
MTETRIVEKSACVRPIPALMYHSVGALVPGWRWNHLVTRMDEFEEQLAALEQAGIQTVTWAQVTAHLRGDIELPARSVLLTFDDGYLDNWTVVAPLLARRGMTGIVFVSGEFVDPGKVLRPTLQDVRDGRIPESQLELHGFLNRAEIASLAQQGPLEIGSHAMTHTWYPVSGQVQDFWTGAPGPYWMAWNQEPQNKWRYLTDPDWFRAVPRGAPVLKCAKSLAGRRFIPDTTARERLIAEAGKYLGDSAASLNARLRKFVETEYGNELPGRQESNDEYVVRIHWELAESRRMLEDITGRPVDYLCWPGGGLSPQAEQIAADVGYKAWTLPSSFAGNRHWNRPGDEPRRLRRSNCGSPWVWRGRAIDMPASRITKMLAQFQSCGRVSFADKLSRLMRVPFFWFYPRVLE